MGKTIDALATKAGPVTFTPTVIVIEDASCYYSRLEDIWKQSWLSLNGKRF